MGARTSSRNTDGSSIRVTPSCLWVREFSPCRSKTQLPGSWRSQGLEATSGPGASNILRYVAPSTTLCPNGGTISLHPTGRALRAAGLRPLAGADARRGRAIRRIFRPEHGRIPDRTGPKASGRGIRAWPRRSGPDDGVLFLRDLHRATEQGRLRGIAPRSARPPGRVPPHHPTCRNARPALQTRLPPS